MKRQSSIKSNESLSKMKRQSSIKSNESLPKLGKRSFSNRSGKSVKSEPEVVGPDVKLDADVHPVNQHCANTDSDKSYDHVKTAKQTFSESYETNGQINSVKEDKEEEVVKKKRKTPTNKTKWPQDPADCDICGTHYTTKRSYQRHYKIVHELISHDCKHCDMQFKWPGKLLKHTKLVHLGIQAKTYPCDKCDKVMKESRNLKRHIAREHPPPGCESCKLSFHDMEGLQEHIRVEHLEKYCKN